MLSVLEALLDTLLVLGTSIWGWLGLVAGLGSAFLVWRVLETSEARAAAAAISFILVFIAFSWQEIKKK